MAQKVKPPSKKGRQAGREQRPPCRWPTCVRVQPSDDPLALLRVCGVTQRQFRAFCSKLVAEWYPGLGKGPGMRLYDDNRPQGWPASETLCTAFRQKKNTAGWAVWLGAAVAMQPATEKEAHRYAWMRRREARPIEPLTERERFACGQRGQFAERTRRRPECSQSAARPSYRTDRVGAVLKWRPLMEWRPLTETVILDDGRLEKRLTGEWGYVKTGEYSVWLLI